MRKKIGLGILGLSLWLCGAGWIAWSGERFPLGRVPVSIQAGKSSGDIQKDIDENNKKRQSAEEEKRQLEKEIAAMEQEKKDTLAYLKSLDDKQGELSEKIQNNRESIRTARREVRKLRQEKKKAASEQKKQYDTMKKRIKYMYENGNEGYIELLIESHSLSELFNRAEYVTKVSDYDRRLLHTFRQLQEKIQRAEEKIQKNLTALTAMGESLRVEKSSMEALMAKKEQQVKEYQNLLADKGDSLKNTEALLDSQEKELENLMAAQRSAAEQEEAARKARQKKADAAKKNSGDKKKHPENDNSQPATATTPPGNKQPVTSGGYLWPLTASGRISSYFGYRNSPTAGASSYHKGIDISVPVGTGVLASKAGTVVTATYSSSAGNYVAISHGNGTYTYYMHCSSLKVRVGQQVSRGQRIALSGNTGISTGPHLHFAVFAGGSYVNPLNYVSR